MSDELQNTIDAIVVGFDEEERVLAQPTAQTAFDDITALINHEVTYEDFKGVVWRGRVIDAMGDVLVVEFEASAISTGGPSGLGQGSLIKVLL